MTPTDTLKHLLATAQDERNSNELLGAAFRANITPLQALDHWLGTFSKPLDKAPHERT